MEALLLTLNLDSRKQDYIFYDNLLALSHVFSKQNSN